MAVLRAARLWLAELSPGSELPPGVAEQPRPDGMPEPLASALNVLTVPSGKKAIVRAMTHIYTGSIPIAQQTGMFVHVFVPGDIYGIAVHRFWAPLNWNAITGAQQVDVWTGTLVLNEGDSVQVSNTAYLYLTSHASGMLVDA